jgi:hypothetical protein
MTTMKGFGKKALSTGMAAAVTTMLALAPSGADAAACAKSITKCGCTINSPGTYSQAFLRMKPKVGTCIDITAGNVTFVSTQMVGPGPTTPTVGIDIEASASRVLIYQGQPSNFGQGIHVDGSNATIYSDYTANNHRGIVVNGANALILNTESQQDGVGIQINKTATHSVISGVVAFQGDGAGIELNGVSGAVLSSVESVENKTFGIWLNGASNNIISNFDAWDNGIAGVYLGCNPAGPDGQASCPSDASSNGNAMLGDSLSGEDDSIVGNGASVLQSYGIAVGLGNLLNDVLTIKGDGNLVDDALDENPNCANNRWLDNTFTISDPAPNTTDYCIN